ncbi:hypothetical protein G3578_02880 [Brevibacillus sp. SYP-B805]|uniref:RCC1 domain-containing protein n=1 Tax=Brevibacillus sp. SYP-B805 TaxID=1578199 RepID=UPI0013EA2327|nr:Ig-like domain-containing protein [Brevibacillus sp. SYP-B805]NGQ94117.1 hypothetical protein [Brevibacillus sp. SYP-B805]
MFDLRMKRICMLLLALCLAGSATAGAAPPAFEASPMVETGFDHTVALDHEGTVWTWGRNDEGQLGVGDVDREETWSPQRVKELEHIVSVSANGHHTLAVDENGDVWAWGENAYGQLGDGTRENRNAPVRVRNLTDVIAAAAGEEHSVAVTKDGSVWVWGRNTFGQLGDGTQEDRLTPVRLEKLSDIAAVAAGGQYTLALTRDGHVWAWRGAEEAPPPAANSRQSDWIVTIPPHEIPELDQVVGIVVHGDDAFAVRRNGTLWRWDAHSEKPRQLKEVNNVSALSVNFREAVILKKDRTVWVLDFYRDRLSQVKELTDVRSVAAGWDHVVAVKSNGTVWSWGENDYGQLGDGTTKDRESPAKIPNLLLSQPSGEMIIQKLKLSPTSLSLRVGESQQLEATAYYRNGRLDVTETARWTSSNPDVLQVTDGKVTALGEGTAEVSVEYRGKRAAIKAKVSALPIKQLLPSSKKLALAPGQKTWVTVKALYSDQSTKDVTAMARWSSSRRSVAAVETGEITAIAPGKTVIRISYKNRSVEIPVTVTEPEQQAD